MSGCPKPDKAASNEPTGNRRARESIHLEADVPEPQSGGLVRGKPYGAFREVDPDDGARLAHRGGGFERDDSCAASDIEDPFAFFHMCELEQTSGDRCVILCHVRVVLAGHTAVLLNQEPGSLLGIQRVADGPASTCTFTDPSPASHHMRGLQSQREWAARFRRTDCTSSRS